MTRSTIKKYFPEVKNIRDAKKPILVEVTKSDVINSKRGKHKECAMAVACKRKMKLDGVLIARSVAYVIKGTTATRFKVPGSLEREVTSFDRGAAFDPGNYSLVIPQRQRRESSKHPGGSHKGRGSIIHRHLTQNIRAVLGGKDAKV